ncbi:MAG: DUF1289 domain-containing protein [Candidatus Diapherotrites archaeon]|nr:DUF1289 domain-containing protein [Candidatus Diapherotrites archaeon]MDZ4255975.1 DUF1289 domain-containing protein [archaeon]
MEQDIPSPCTNVCTLDEESNCTGCGRTLEEILNWPHFNSEEKKKVLSRCCPSLLRE